MPYDERFLGKKVALPKLSRVQKKDTVVVGPTRDWLLSHHNYSVALSASRRLAWFSCSNIDAGLKQPVTRKELTSNWRVEDFIPKTAIIDDQWYKASEKILHRGHLTPADVMEWGEDAEKAIENANSTFYFSNAAPQVGKLNSNEWRFMEKYIGDEAAKTGHSRICVQTGPVLLTDDPLYGKHMLPDFSLKLPRLFWKVVYYLNPAGKLCRIGFLMSQNSLLKANGLIMEDLFERKTTRDETGPFTDLDDQKTYQVNVPMIESLTGLKLHKAHEPFTNDKPQALILMDVDIKPRNPDPMFESTGPVRKHLMLGLTM